MADGALLLTTDAHDAKRLIDPNPLPLARWHYTALQITFNQGPATMLQALIRNQDSLNTTTRITTAITNPFTLR